MVGQRGGIEVLQDPTVNDAIKTAQAEWIYNAGKGALWRTVTVVGTLLMTALLIAGTLVTANRVAQAIWGPRRSRRPVAAAARHALPDSVRVHAWIEERLQGQAWPSEARRELPLAVEHPALEPDRVWTAEEWSA